MSTESLVLWGGFTLFIVAMLALDLGVFQRKPHVIGMKEALSWFGVWTGLALIFNIGILLFHERGGEAGLEFFTGFLVEKSLSIDNIFVFILIFGYFKVPQLFQHKVLFWGIVGAIILRVTFIIGGLALMERFHWMIYVFGAFLLFTGISMMRKKETHTNPEDNWVIRTFRRFFPVSDRYDGNKFFTKIDGRMAATPLFVVLLAVESSDIIFAVDSIPAIFAITQEPFLVYTSNVFAMLGLRSLYFAVAGFMRMFHFLHYGFASIILILGVKMLLSEVYKLPVAVSLVLILVILLLCVIVSLLRPRLADLKLMFERPERLGLLPFRRLLLIENIMDSAMTTVRDSMHPRETVRCLRLDLPWEENLAMIRTMRFSRYPVQENANAKPVGVVHIKDLLAGDGASSPMDLHRAMRPVLELPESMPIDDAMTKLQRGHLHMAIVSSEQGDWTGLLTLEDVLEELVGKIGDEFDAGRSGQSVSLADAMCESCVVLDLHAESLSEAIQQILRTLPVDRVPAAESRTLEDLLQRDHSVATAPEQALAVAHARLANLKQPTLAFARSHNGIPLPQTNDRVELIFLLILPDTMAELEPRLLVDIIGLMESDYVTERLKTADEAHQVIEAVREGQQAVLD